MKQDQIVIYQTKDGQTQIDVRLENENGKDVDIGEAVKVAANTVVNTATTAAKTVKEEMEKAQ